MRLAPVFFVFVANMILVWLLSIREATVVLMFMANTCKARGHLQRPCK